jgi:hypothetical protein
VSVCSVYTVHSRVGCRPPKCLTCPCFLRGQTPCIGIITVLANLQPFDVIGRPKLTVSDWLQGNSLLRPEIFQNRWRTDKDPTKDLASYAAILKQPLSRTLVADDASHAVLEQDLENQFRSDMLALSALDDNAKQHALRQLKPVMGKFSSVVAKFVMDARIMKTSQGRGAGRSETSIIAKKTAPKTSAAATPRPMFPAHNSATSAIATSAFANAKGYGEGVPKSARRRPGNNDHIEEKWMCPVCKTEVKDCSQSIQQHKDSKKHLDLIKKLHYCDRCNIYCDNTPAAIQLHNESFDHGHQQRLEGDARDGPSLAQKRRAENDGQVQGGLKKRTKGKGKL